MKAAGLLALAALVEHRASVIDSLSTGLVEEADRLTVLLDGAPQLDLPDQRDAIRQLLVPERKILLALIEQHMRAPAAALRRWNGHVARVSQIEAVRTLLALEILTARGALDAALAHEADRYQLDHIWNDLELRFGRIEYRGGQTPGTWSVPDDRKSTYFYFLTSPRGEVLVEMPWDGALQVRHEGRPVASYSLFTPPDAIARSFGALGARWRQLAIQLANPSWHPDLPPGGVT